MCIVSIVVVTLWNKVLEFGPTRAEFIPHLPITFRDLILSQESFIRLLLSSFFFLFFPFSYREKNKLIYLGDNSLHALNAVGCSHRVKETVVSGCHRAVVPMK